MRRNQGVRPQGNFNRDRKSIGPRDDGEPIDAFKFVHIIRNLQRDLALLKCLDNAKVPRFGAQVMHDDRQIGTVEDVLGPVAEHYVVMKPLAGVQLGQLEVGRIFQLGTNALLGIEKFLPQPVVKKTKQPQNKAPGRGGRFGKPAFGDRGAPRREGFNRDGPRSGSQGGRDSWRSGPRQQGGSRFNR